MFRIFRPAGASTLVSARYFQDRYLQALSPELEFQLTSLHDLLGTIWSGPPPAGRKCFPDLRAADAFRQVMSGYDFLCPGHDLLPLTSLLLRLRNLGHSPIRLLLLAHAPGACPLDWALLAPLLRPGDRVIVPSGSGLRVLRFLHPAIMPFARVIGHPIAPVQAAAAAPHPQLSRNPEIVTLARLVPEKLIHRQIDALARLNGPGDRLVRMRICGPLTTEAGHRHGYARALAARCRRLGLEKRVHLAGEVAWPHASAILQGATMAVCLSATVEETFPKACVEALAHGLPVLATDFDGLPELVGAAGRLIPLQDIGPGLALDVDPYDVADGIRQILARPATKECCQAQVARFAPDRVRREYVACLGEALQEHRRGSFEKIDLSQKPALDLDMNHDMAPDMNPEVDQGLAQDLVQAHPGWPATGQGLLFQTAPLSLITPNAGWSWTWPEALTDAFTGFLPESQTGPPGEAVSARTGSLPGVSQDGAWLRTIVAQGTAKIVARFMAGLPSALPGETNDRGAWSEGQNFAQGQARDLAQDLGRYQAQDVAPSLDRVLLDVLQRCEQGCPPGTATSVRSCLAALSRRIPDTLVSARLSRVLREGQLGGGAPGARFLQADALRALGRFAEARDLCLSSVALNPKTGFGEFATFQLRLLARICRESSQPGEALHWLRLWLNLFPDNSDSGPVWLDLAWNSLLVHRKNKTIPGKEAWDALLRAEELLEPSGVLDALRREMECGPASGREESA